MFLLVGLGNPGAKYAGIRHNAGFMAIDAIAGEYCLTEQGAKFNSICHKGSIAGKAVLAMKPQTYMNNSGKAVLAASQFYKIPPERIIVCHDELDLATAKCRIKRGGGHGGHNGLRDIDRVLGKDYWRIRIGIDHPGRKEMVTSYVLHPFTAAEQDAIDVCCTALATHIGYMFENAPDRLMNAVALKMQY